ncbi:MAG TPA: TIM barrel protein [Desulfuromonadaceae bacterium]|nr:TIM barrel protein [Desulfuromonadaceae bacterium]
MKLYLFKTLWGHQGPIDAAIAGCRASGFDGIEGQVPADRSKRIVFQRHLADSGLEFIAEICTAGSYVPDRHATVARHLQSLRRQIERGRDCHPLFFTVIAGCDAWSVAQSVDFFGDAMAMARELGVVASFETHRSRSFFNPWATRDILKQLPDLKLTCDFSHWCVVCERLIDTEPDVLALCIERAYHVHARVGYAQGPQVPHPAAVGYRDALEAHENWWLQIWRGQFARRMAVSTMTPEFGPDGYLQSHPFTHEPAADLDEINRWMANRQRERFIKYFAGTHQTKPIGASRPARSKDKNYVQ